MSKNAVLARENRFKKKKFIDDILRKNKFLSGQNSHLKSKCEKYDRNVYSLRKEVSYLKNIIHNQSTLSKLLKSIPSLVKDQFDESSDELIDVIDYNRNECPDVRPPNPSCGICLHVANNTVLLEMCHSCSSKAQLAHKNWYQHFEKPLGQNILCLIYASGWKIYQHDMVMKRWHVLLVVPC